MPGAIKSECLGDFVGIGSQDELKQAIASSAEPAPLLHPNLAEVYRQKVAALRQCLDAAEPDLEAVERKRCAVPTLPRLTIFG
jgi:hypothetical protein